MKLSLVSSLRELVDSDERNWFKHDPRRALDEVLRQRERRQILWYELMRRNTMKISAP